MFVKTNTLRKELKKFIVKRDEWKRKQQHAVAQTKFYNAEIDKAIDALEFQQELNTTHQKCSNEKEKKTISK